LQFTVVLAAALGFCFVVFFEQLPRTLDAGGHVLKHRFRTGTLRMQEHPQGFGKDDLVFENGALDFIHHLHRQQRRAAAKRNGLLCWLGSGGAVARVPSLITSCAPFLTPLCASRSSFLTPFGAPASTFLSPLRTRLRRIGGRRRGGGGRGGGLGFNFRHRQKRR
jgi:hypothetical protein